MDTGNTYTNWHIDISYDETTECFFVYKTRFCRPNWWTKNIGSPGYKEKVELATVHTAVYSHFYLGNSWLQRRITDIDWNKDISLSEKLAIKSIVNDKIDHV